MSLNTREVSTPAGGRSGNPPVRTRGRTGCLNCRRRRKKCDEKRPTCSKCRSKGERCEWDSGMIFRVNTVESMDHGHRPSSQSFQTNEIDFGRSIQGLNQPRPIPDSTSAEASQRPFSINEGLSAWPWVRSESDQNSNTTEVGDNAAFLPNDVLEKPAEPARTHGSQVSPSSTSYTIHGTNTDFTDMQLSPLDYLTTRTSNWRATSSMSYYDETMPWFSGSRPEDMTSPLALTIAGSPDIWAAYYPNDTYRELHTTLHNSIVETAKRTGFTRAGTPERSASQSPDSDGNPETEQASASRLAQRRESIQNIPSKLKISPHREMELWSNYLEEIAPWLDMFDSQRHFQYTLPVLAKGADHLRLSILALSARQIERRSPNSPYIESLDLYQEAIQLIVPELQSMDTTVIASCVLLCVLEMMSSSPRDWSKHLDGCAILLQAADITGIVGGMKQAIFWCFARMDVWGGFLTESFPKIPTNQWLDQSGTMTVTVSQFRAGLEFDSYANYAVFLCASVLTVITRQHTSTSQQDRRSSYSKEWKAMFDVLADWYNGRPEKMRPLFSYPTEVEDLQSQFPVILYGNPSAINGNQLYHTSALLMLQEKPKDVRLSRGTKSALWHARQICGISGSNFNHGAWINALQPLWIAGKRMSHPSEHKAILDILARIELETGWATSWRAEDLKDFWGLGG